MMFFYGVIKSDFGRTGGEIVSLHVTRDAAVRMINMCLDGDDMADPQRNYEYKVKNIPVNVEKLVELGVINLES
jgi:hypothetical protein